MSSGGPSEASGWEPSDESVEAGISDVHVSEVRISEVRICERAVGQRSLAERLLCAAATDGVIHLAVDLARSVAVSLHIGDAWQSPRSLADARAEVLGLELESLCDRAEPSCDEGVSHTLRLILPGVGPCAFRLHRFREVFVVSPVTEHDVTPWILDRQHERSRRERFQRGLAALAAARMEEGAREVAQAIEMADALGRAPEQIHMTLAYGAALERAGLQLDAERCYKRARDRIVAAYGRRDMQRGPVFERLMRCAASRGDRAVSQMWRLRAQGAMQLPFGPG